MSKNLNQIPTAATTILATDKMYIARSPFGITDDRYILGSDIIAQLSSPLTTKGDLFAYSTLNTRLPVAVGDGKILQVSSGAATGLAYSTPTYPSTSGIVGKLLRTDGTNNVYSTTTFADTYTASSVLYSNGANTVVGLTTAINGLLVTNNTGVPSILVGSGATGNILRSTAAGAPTWSTAQYPDIAGTSGNILTSNGTNWVSSAPASSGIVNSGLINQMTWYAATGTTVSGLATIANGVLVTSAGSVPSISTTLPAGLTIPGYQTTLTLPLSLANGGTNASLTASTGGIVYSGASAFAVLAGTATANQIIMSGLSAAPSWSTATYPATTTANQILYSSATNTISQITAAASSVLITSAGSIPSLSQTLPSAVQANITTVGTITSGVWNGSVIGLAYGGTNANLTASNGGIFYSTATAGAILSGTATAAQMLQSGSTAAPTWSTSTWPATTTANQLLYSSFNNTVAGLASANNGVLVTSGAGVPSISNTFGQGLAMAGSVLSVGGANAIPFNSGIGIIDSNSNAMLAFTTIASAVNFTVMANAATGLPPVLTAAGSDANISIVLTGKGTGGVAIHGVSDGSNAATGYVGELVSSVVLTASAVSLTSTNPANVTSISLTAGDWEVSGTVWYKPNAATITQLVFCGINTTSATISSTPSANTSSAQQFPIATAGVNPLVPIAPCRISISATTTVYLVAQATFSVNSNAAYGVINARRMR